MKKNNYPNHRNHETQEWEKVRVLDYTYCIIAGGNNADAVDPNAK